jgi:hypothetical protein
VYKIWENGGYEQANLFARSLYSVLRHGGDVDQWVPRLERFRQDAQDPTSRYYIPVAKRWDAKIDALIRITRIFAKMLRDLPLTVQGLDLHEGNAAVDKRGNLILLDPFVAEMKAADAVKLWQKLGWDVKPQVVQRPKIK